MKLSELTPVVDERTIERLNETARSIQPDAHFVKALGGELRANYPARRKMPAMRWVASAAAALVLAITLFFLITPTGRALGQQLAQFFQRDADNTQTVESFGPEVYPTLVNDPNVSVFVDPDSTAEHGAYEHEVDEVMPAESDGAEPPPGSQVTLSRAALLSMRHNPMVPTYLPENYHFDRVYTITSSSSFMDFKCTEFPWGFTLVQYHQPDDYEVMMYRPSVGQDAVIEYVPIWDGITAEYVRGAWRFADPYFPTLAPGETRNVDQVWDSTLDGHQMTWRTGSGLFIMKMNGMILETGAMVESDCMMTREDFIGIAESLIPYETD